jgi:hypothetical protein
VNLLALETQSPTAFEFVSHVGRAYAKLIQSTPADQESLGGKLFYAGELDEQGRELVIAANIAGAATLVAAADRTAQKQAIRDGVTDFLVNSLDEALRILKNQLRKREAVAVCVGLPPEAVEREMRERGVAPDLLRANLSVAPRHPAHLLQEGRRTESDSGKITALVTWRVGSATAQWLPKLDEIAIECLGATDGQARRWVRLAPRYLGRLANGLRSLSCNREAAASFIECVRQRVERGEIAVAVEVQSYFSDFPEIFHFRPL